MDLRLFLLSIKHREINLESEFTTTGSFEDIECSSNFLFAFGCRSQIE